MSRARRRGVTAFLVAAVAAGLTLPAPASAGWTSTNVSQLRQTGKRLWGGAASGGYPTFASLNQFELDAGKRVGIYLYFKSWARDADFNATEAQAVRNRGAMPMLTWEPWDPSYGVNQPSYSLARISSGYFDSYIHRWAQEVRAWGQPILFRFAHEMNGNWYPWSEGVNGNLTGQYARAWRHVRDIFSSEGALNAEWVWSPTRMYVGSTPVAGLYPGDAYTDWVAIDAYNRGSTSTSGWKTFSQLFGTSLSTLRALAPTKPLMIAETASVEQGGSKAAWISDFFTQLRNNPDILAFVWFNIAKPSTDWRIETSASAQAAFKSGISDPRYH
jgi:beta-mannanase